MDCSLINWFASANYSDKIPDPIRSRFTVFNIASPTVQQQRLIAQSVYDDLLLDNLWGDKYKKVLSKNVIDKLLKFSARKQKSVLFAACSEVAFRCEDELNSLLEILATDIEEEKGPVKRSIGFH